MNTNTNMLSAQKVKIHGMVSSRWTTKDKIIQYKGLIKLYTRDKKIMDLDKAVAEKKQYKELKNIQIDIEENRKILDNAICGERQKLRNTLAEHRELQLAYDKSQPRKVLEMVNQVEFTKRKELDRLAYKMRLKSEQLINLKLKHAEIEDRIKEEKDNSNMIKEEREAHLITGHVQDATLKKEAAMSIQRTYRQMIEIMRKDALYYDAVLITIRNDGINQGKCMINATKLGQLATEYLDDRKKEFNKLEKVVLKDMTQRKEDLKRVNKQVERLHQTTRSMMRRDSDINLGTIEIAPTESMIQLHDDIETIENTLSYLKYAIFVPTFDDLYPCLQDQLNQKSRLQKLVAKCEKNRNQLLKKKNHAKMMASIMDTTMADTTLTYKTDKQNRLDELKELRQRTKDTSKLITTRYELLARVRVCLKHLQLIASLLATTKRQRTDKIAVMSRLVKIHSTMALPEVPDREEIDGTKMIKELNGQYGRLSSLCKESSGVSQDLQYLYFEEMIHHRTRTIALEKPVVEGSLVEGIFLDSSVLSREDIKKESADIVAVNMKMEELLPPDQRRKSKFL